MRRVEGKSMSFADEVAETVRKAEPIYLAKKQAVVDKLMRSPGAPVDMVGGFVAATVSYRALLEEAAEYGIVVIAPNRLPIRCVRHDGALLEHEHADHDGYIRPIEAEYTGELPLYLHYGKVSYKPKMLALLFAKGNVALTIYEWCYDIWRLDTGEHLGGSSWFAKGWRLKLEE
jgi:hypothetical protein